MLSCHPDPFAAFCRDLQIPGTECHVYRGPNAFGCTLTDPSDVPRWWDDENVYFLAGVRPGLKKRAADRDVLQRNMFTLDFDIRKARPDGDFAALADAILTALEPHPLFGNMRYAVLSGNGLHIHYFGDPVPVQKEQWAAGMKSLFAEVNALSPVPCDTGCHNAGRIMRFPGSWNLKDPQDRKPVTVEVWMPRYTVGSLSFVHDRGEEEQRAREEEQRELPEADGSDVIALINNIPIEQVVAQLFPGVHVRTVKKDGGMRFADEYGKERGFFRHHQHNILVHEGTALFPAPAAGHVGYNPLGLVKAVHGCTAAEAIAWFAARSAPVREAQVRERAEWIEKTRAKDIAFFDTYISAYNP